MRNFKAPSYVLQSLIIKLVQRKPQRKPRQRKIPRRFDYNTNNEEYVFKTPKDMYRKLYLEVYDQVYKSLNSRFNTDSSRFYKSLEAFAIGYKSNDIQCVIDFYQDDFDKDKLLTDRDMFLHLVKNKGMEVNNVRAVVDFLRTNELGKYLPEYNKLIQLILTIPGSSCTNKRSFSVLRRLKDYLRSTMSQDRLNSIAILHTFSDEAELDYEKLMDEFISRNSKRAAVFSLSQKNKITKKKNSV